MSRRVAGAGPRSFVPSDFRVGCDGSVSRHLSAIKSARAGQTFREMSVKSQPGRGFGDGLGQYWP
jgi:hypothetical protein